MIELIPGSKCVVYLTTTNEEIAKVSGTFEGFVPVGEDSSLCIRLDENHGDKKGLIRLIPVNMVAAIDVIELAEKKESDEKYEDTGHYYS